MNPLNKLTVSSTISDGVTTDTTSREVTIARIARTEIKTMIGPTGDQSRITSKLMTALIGPTGGVFKTISKMTALIDNSKTMTKISQSIFNRIKPRTRLKNSTLRTPRMILRVTSRSSTPGPRSVDGLTGSDFC